MSTKVIKGVIFCLIAFMGAFLGPIFMLCPFLPLLFLPPVIKPTIFRRIVDRMIWFWECLLAGLLDHIAGVKSIITGDQIRGSEHCLFLMNHRTRLDWMFFWSCLFRMRALHHERVILKGELKHIPGPGWSMQYGLFVFIKRKWEIDKIILTKILDHFKDVGNIAQLLLFPEGTDFTAYTKARSDAFADKNGLEKYNYVLHPRTTGFVFLTQHMKKNRTLDAIYDITIGYPKYIPQSELSLFRGDFPAEVHYDIKRYPLSDLPDTDEGLVEWCQKLWQEKEKQLEKFYVKKTFDKPLTVMPDSHHAFSLLSVIIWLVLMLLQIYCIVKFSLVRWYVLIAIISMAVIERKFDGIDMWQIDVYNRLFRKKVD